MSNNKILVRRELPSALIKEKAAQCSRNLSIDLSPFVPVLRERFGDSIQGILLYGSCLHTESLENSVVDLYVVVDGYTNAYKSRFLRRLNTIVPPNVFYLEVSGEEQTLRAKYGVISLEDFEDGAGQWFHSYIWGRFAQPIRILYVKNEEVRVQLHHILAQSTVTFLEESIPALGNSIVDSETIWTRGLALSYDAELRPERATRARQLTHLNMGDYKRLMACASPLLDNLIEALPHDRYRCLTDERTCRRSLRRWRLRSWLGRILSVMRLAKAVFTFADCIDYAAWKIERHTGIQIEVTPQLRKHPILLGWRVLFQLIRKGVMH